MMLLALALAVDLCAGRVVDKAEHPMLPYVLDPTNLQPVTGKPPLGVPYLDPSFGTIITRIAEPPVSEGANAIIKTLYSTQQGFNADETILLLWHRGKGFELYEGDAPYRYIGPLPINPTDIEHVLWDPVEPRTLYYPHVTGQGRFVLRKVTLGPPYADVETADFNKAPASCPVGVNHNINRAGLGADPDATLAGSRKLVGLMCGPKGTRKFLYSVTEGSVVTALTFSEGPGPVAPVVDQSERHVFLAGYIGKLDFSGWAKVIAKFPFEHSQVGNALWHTVAFDPSSPGANDAGMLVTHNMADLTRRVIVGPASGYPYIPAGVHVSATGPHPWVFVGNATHGVNLPLAGELVLANTETGQVCRVGHSRTFAGTDCGPRGDECSSYFSETHGFLSRKGTRAVFTSDGMGFTGPPWRSTGVYVLDLRRPPLKVRLTSLCDVTSLSPQQAKCSSESLVVVP